MPPAPPALDPQRFRRARDLFDRLAELPVDARDALLAAECGSDEALRRQVDAWLASDEDDERLEQLDRSGQPLLGDWLAEREAERDRQWLGQRIGRYTVDGILGQGGMGLVLSARTADGRAVALKLIRPEQATPELARRFEREFRLLARVADAGIVKPLEFGRSGDNLLFLALERVEGRELGIVLPELDLRRRVELLAAAAASVGAAHALGIVHRDLKPSNLMVDTAGRLRVLDFGIAKDVGSLTATTLTATGDLLFTPRYAAPEQRALRPATTATDVYALGAMLAEWLADPNVAVGRLDATQRRQLDAIAATATATEGAARQRDGTELATELTRVLTGQAPPWRSAAHPLRRALKTVGRPRVLAAVLLGVIAAATATGWQHWRQQRIDTEFALTRGDLVELDADGRAQLADALALYRSGNREGALILLDALVARDRDAVWPLLLRQLLSTARGARRTALDDELSARLARHPAAYAEALAQWQREPRQAARIAAALALRPDAWRLRLADYERLRAATDAAATTRALAAIDADRLPPGEALDLAIDQRLAGLRPATPAIRDDLSPYAVLLTAADELGEHRAERAQAVLAPALDAPLPELRRRALRLSALAALDAGDGAALADRAGRWRDAAAAGSDAAIDASVLVAAARQLAGDAAGAATELERARAAALDAAASARIDAASTLLPGCTAGPQRITAALPPWLGTHLDDWLRRRCGGAAAGAATARSTD